MPKAPVTPLPGMKQQMCVLATYADGSVRDVSNLAFVETSNADVATVDKQGLVTSVRRGEATMLARFEGSYAATTMIVMGDRSNFAWNNAVEQNFIDQLVDEKLKLMKILPSELCSDVDFLRRIYLDLTGLTPAPSDVRAFLADTRPTKVKREAVIEKLIGGPDFVEYWTNKWADLLQVNRKFLGDEGIWDCRWIRQALSTNMPYDKFAYSVLTRFRILGSRIPRGLLQGLRDPDASWRTRLSFSWPSDSVAISATTIRSSSWTQDQCYQLAAPTSLRSAARKIPASRAKRLVVPMWSKHSQLVEIIYDTESRRCDARTHLGSQ